MRRREVIAAIGSTAAVWPLLARAQQGEEARRVGVLSYGADADWPPIRKRLHERLERLGWVEGRNLQLDFRVASGDAAQTRFFAADLVQLAPDVIVTVSGVALRTVRQQTKTIPIVFTLPALVSFHRFLHSGLISYDVDDDLFLGAATYVDRLLRGAKVSDLPVQYPTKFRLVINLKTTKSLGLVVPPSMLLRADEVIE
ncbi:MAG TPA: ABC transporter substrate binding protein [Xanthobacteraceae bacterium]|nr:ABC transporter substrate binding protein [Xanthobacteraceae bacterium]